MQRTFSLLCIYSLSLSLSLGTSLTNECLRQNSVPVHRCINTLPTVSLTRPSTGTAALLAGTLSVVCLFVCCCSFFFLHLSLSLFISLILLTFISSLHTHSQDTDPQGPKMKPMPTDYNIGRGLSRIRSARSQHRCRRHAAHTEPHFSTVHHKMARDGGLHGPHAVVAVAAATMLQPRMPAAGLPSEFRPSDHLAIASEIVLPPLRGV